ncbi:hypothetical protein NIES267_56090 [Calothrix parasitica NIES-267]|uniref:Uncharacterized protein n=1 Tax=Calothrix parasitica NIES-267 TaxID=1973488 RepID=A0A1Z4LY01_9CYAN|nr:hypothetical protein NIES267_56090 [Calothrix parasitica NIES-267]
MMNLTLVAQQLEIPLEQLKLICQVLKIEIVKNAVTPNDKQKVQEFIGVCKDKQITVEQGLSELEQLQKEAQTQQKVLGERFNLDEFFKQRIGTSPEELNTGSYHYDLYQLLLKSQSISQVGYTLFREAFLRQTQDLIMNGTETSSINQNQTVAGFDKAFEDVETQFEQNFLGTSVNWGEQEHPMLAGSRKTALPSGQKTNISPSPSSNK